MGEDEEKGEDRDDGYASPPCLAHEADPTHMGLPPRHAPTTVTVGRGAACEPTSNTSAAPITLLGP